jgi:putative transposase
MQNGYGAFTDSHNDKDQLINHIKRQAEHQRKISFKDELRELLTEAGVEFDEKWFLK